MKRILLFLSMLLCLTAANAQKECDGGDKNPPDQKDPDRHHGDDGTITQLPAMDPNDLIGPEGYDSVRWVSINDVLNYTIRFENSQEFALANAQYVDIRFDFWNKVAMRGFGLGTFGFANRSWPIDKSPAAYQNRLDLRDTMQIYVDLTAGVDVTKQQGFWTFNSIDPETGVNPWQTDRGMLPINDSTHVGEGFVTFTLRPQDDLKTGDTISIQASIVFDQNDTIPTNRWCNKIDAGNPESKVTAELHPTLPNTYNLKFTGKDDEGGSGIRHLLLYLANHNGIYEEIDTVSVDTVLAFPVEGGKQYKLYSIAVDNTGNREPAKEEPDVILNFNQAPTDIALSDTIFQDDLEAGGFVGKLTSIDSEDEKTFTYALAEGDGAIHNDLFQINGSQLQAKSSFKCADDSVYKVRISTTDDGGMSFSKAFTLTLKHVLEKPKPDTLTVSICEGDIYNFHSEEYDKAGTYYYTVSNDYMCDSVYVIQLSVLPRLEAPIVTIEGDYTLVSSASKGNQWFTIDGNKVEGATGQRFTPTDDGVYYVCVSNGACYSEPSNAFRVQISNSFTLSLNLSQGWNWMSSNLSDDKYKAVKDFVQPIEEKIEGIISFDKEIIRDPELGLTGNLKNLSPTEGYLVQTNDTVSNGWVGHAYKTEDSTITLEKGWNWIGYVPMYENTLERSLAGLKPTEGDVIKDYRNFATYSNGKWVGTLTMMHPGNGYMYNSAQATSFQYPVLRAFEYVNDPQAKMYAAMVQNKPWAVQHHKYPYNMNVIAQVYADGQVIPAGLYTVGAFVGDECRGIGQYVDDRIFMTIYGDVHDSERVTFKAMDCITQEEYTIKESMTFDNVMHGTVNAPFRLHLDGMTGINSAESDSYNIFPNPVRYTLYINGDISRLVSVSLVALNGAVVATTDSYTEKGMNVSALSDGTYIAVLKLNDGSVIVKKIIKVN